MLYPPIFHLGSKNIWIASRHWDFKVEVVQFQQIVTDIEDLSQIPLVQCISLLYVSFVDPPTFRPIIKHCWNCINFLQAKLVTVVIRELHKCRYGNDLYKCPNKS